MSYEKLWMDHLLDAKAHWILREIYWRWWATIENPVAGNTRAAIAGELMP